MVWIINAMVVLFSICIALLIGMQQLSLGMYFILIGIEYLAVLVLNKNFRKLARKFFNRKGEFGVESKHYGVVHLENLDKDLEQMDPIAFEYFIRDLFRSNGYKATTTPATKDFGADVIAKKGKEVLAIQVKHRNSSDWSVNNEAVQEVVASMAIYKANRSMVVTNGTFTEHALAQALPNATLMVDGKELYKMIYNWSCNENKSGEIEKIKDSGEIEGVQSDGIIPLEEK